MAAELDRRAGAADRGLFQAAPVAIWEADVTALQAWYEQLRGQGVTAVRPLLEGEPQMLQAALGLVTVRRVNPASVALFEARDQQHLREHIQTALATASRAVLIEILVARWENRLTFAAETPLTTLQGRPLHVLVAVAAPEEAGHPDLSRVVVVFSDITARKRAEEALRESEEHFRVLAETIPEIVFSEQSGQGCLYSNSRFYEYTGLPAGTAEGAGWLGAVHPDDLAHVEQLWRASLASGEPFECEYRLRAADGSYHWFLERARPIRDAQGQTVRWFGVSTDVDLVKRMEQELADRATLLRLAEEAGSIGSFEYRPLTGQVRVSPQFWAIFGLEAGSIPSTGVSWAQYVPEEDVLRLKASFRTLSPERPLHRLEFRIRRPQGEIRWLESRGRGSFDVQGKLVAMVGVIVDITERRRTEEALRKSEAFYRTLIETLPVTVTLADPQGRITYISPAAGEMFGLQPGEGLGTTPTDWIAAEHHVLVRQRMQKVLVERQRQPAVEYRMLRRDGSSVWAQLASAPILDSQGELTGVITVCQDVTERKLTLERLREREELLRMALEVSHTGWWHWDLASGQVSTDAPAKALFGLPPEAEASLDVFLHSLAPEEVPRVLAELPTAMRSETEFHSEFHLRWPDGSDHWVLAKGRALPDESGGVRNALGVLMDITERKRAEEALNQLNQTLEEQVNERTAVAERRAGQLRVLASELTKAEQRERRRLAQVLHDHFQQLLYAAKLKLGQLRSRCKEEGGHRLLEETLRLLDDSISESRSLAVELSPPVLYDRGLVGALEWLARDFSQKHQLPISVDLEAAAEPCDEGIRVFLFGATRELLLNIVKHAQATSARIELHSGEDDQIHCQVSDTGRGFEAASLERQEASKGFGLLSIRERLQLLGGHLEIDTAPGRGSRMRLVVPRGSPSTSAERSREAVAVASRVALGTGGVVEPAHTEASVRVLVADDHQVLREGLITVLQEQPEIEVVGEAADGQQACELALCMKPDVVLMDISMPRMDGIEATRCITQALPEVRVIGLSMHTQADMAAAMRAAGAVGYLSKEVASEVLIATVLAEAASHG